MDILIKEQSSTLPGTKLHNTVKSIREMRALEFAFTLYV